MWGQSEIVSCEFFCKNIIVFKFTPPEFNVLHMQLFLAIIIVNKYVLISLTGAMKLIKDGGSTSCLL